VKTALAIAAQGAYFEGHFPGHPILPGVVQLMLVLEALERQGGPAAELRKIVFARLRRPVLPGEYLELISRPIEPGRTRFELTRDGAVVTNGELVLASTENMMLPCCVIPAAGQVAALPPLDDLLPHRAPMRLITAIAAEHADGLDCLACVPAACALVRNGRAYVVAGIEAAAQAAAAWEAVRRWRMSNGAGPRIGYLVAMRDVEFAAQSIPAECAFVVSVRLETATPPLIYYRFTVSLDGSALAQGLFATFMTL
jgi:predicted hotdog family 3-hydroxylacyl-ACP dehydratase